MGVLFGAVVYFSVSRNDEAPQSSVTENIAVTTDSLREFDPNTVDFKTLRAMGVEARVATSLLKYRAAGKVYRIPEDVATCYGMTDSVYFALEPYIRISPEYRITRPDRLGLQRRRQAPLDAAGQQDHQRLSEPGQPPGRGGQRNQL